ncbi:MAG: hypothetical protein ACR2GC_03055 [Methyloceanibacter sp.]|uniref:hypothetical protein n=1 Tax=Methyloceanibacter sp. TaxID=1965321 RepID=UPI003D9BFD15
MTDRLGLTLEMFGEVEDMANAGSFDAQEHSIGPAFYYTFEQEWEEDGKAKSRELVLSLGARRDLRHGAQGLYRLRVFLAHGELERHRHYELAAVQVRGDRRERRRPFDRCHCRLVESLGAGALGDPARGDLTIGPDRELHDRRADKLRARVDLVLLEMVAQLAEIGRVFGGAAAFLLIARTLKLLGDARLIEGGDLRR